MARRPVINTSSLQLTAPNYTALLRSIDQLQDAERDFYNDRMNELNSYLGQGGKSRNDVENAYNSLLGMQPWEYTNIFNNAGNSLDTTETSDEEDDDGNDADLVFVQLPSALSQFSTHEENTIQFNPGIGFREVDLLYTNISFFTTPGETFSADDDQGFSGDYQTGFNELPVAYQSNNNLSGYLAHMYRLIGNRYDSAVGPKYNNYINQVNAYNNYVGGGSSETFTGGTPDQPYKDHQPASGTEFGYNRPTVLSIKIVEEARGYN